MFIKRSGKKICDFVTYCDSVLSSFLGLRFRRLKKGECLFFNSVNRFVVVDGFFMLHCIDVVFLDKNMKVIKIVENFRPFFFTSSNCKFFLELGSGVVKKTGLKVGDVLAFKR